MRTSDLFEYDEEDEFEMPQIETHVLTAGTHLFHGTSARFDERAGMLSSPAWFSDNPKPAQFFVDWHDHHEKGARRIIDYVLDQDVKLVLIHGRHTLDMLNEYYGVDIHGGSEEMAESICRLGYDGWIIPDNYTTGPDIMLCDTSVVSHAKTRRALPKI